MRKYTKEELEARIGQRIELYDPETNRKANYGKLIYVYCEPGENTLGIRVKHFNQDVLCSYSFDYYLFAFPDEQPATEGETTLLDKAVIRTKTQMEIDAIKRRLNALEAANPAMNRVQSTPAEAIAPEGTSDTDVIKIRKRSEAETNLYFADRILKAENQVKELTAENEALRAKVAELDASRREIMAETLKTVDASMDKDIRIRKLEAQLANAAAVNEADSANWLAAKKELDEMKARPVLDGKALCNEYHTILSTKKWGHATWKRIVELRDTAHHIDAMNEALRFFQPPAPPSALQVLDPEALMKEIYNERSMLPPYSRGWDAQQSDFKANYVKATERALAKFSPPTALQAISPEAFAKEFYTTVEGIDWESYAPKAISEGTIENIRKVLAKFQPPSGPLDGYEEVKPEDLDRGDNVAAINLGVVLTVDKNSI